MIVSNGLGCSSCGGKKFAEEGLEGIFGGLGFMVNGVEGAYDSQGNFVPGLVPIYLQNADQLTATYNAAPPPSGPNQATQQQAIAAATGGSVPASPDIVIATKGTGEGIVPSTSATPNPQTPAQQQASTSGGGGTLAVPASVARSFNLSNILLFGGIGLLALAFVGGGGNKE